MSVDALLTVIDPKLCKILDFYYYPMVVVTSRENAIS